MNNTVKIIVAAIVGLSMIGGIVGYWMGNIRDQSLKNAEVMYTHDFRTNNGYTSIIVIKNDSDTLRYLNSMIHGYETVEYLSESLEENTKVHVLEKRKSGLFKIAVVNEDPDSRNPPYREYWIWKEFLKREN